MSRYDHALNRFPKDKKSEEKLKKKAEGKKYTSGSGVSTTTINASNNYVEIPHLLQNVITPRGYE